MDSVATKIENGPKTKMKILWSFEKSSKILISLKMFEERKILALLQIEFFNPTCQPTGLSLFMLLEHFTE